MLDYEKQIFLDILQEDGLVVGAKGLGLENVVVNLLQAHCDPGNLVLVLGTEGKHQEWLVSKMNAAGANPAPRVLSSETGVAERESSYLDGGVWFIPTRILVVDMLKKRLPVDLITGFVVWKAHNILKNHQESFILRLFRQGNKTGFIKAFSNHAPGFTGSITKVEQILKALFVRKLFLWPRYHAGIKSCLSMCKPKVVELHLEMSASMLQLQNALLDLIKSSIQEMKRLNPMLDAEEVTVENAICDSFQKLLHSQLDPVWHALSERTKLLLADLKLFHYMVRTLLTHDSVSFYHLVRTQRNSERVRSGSGWQLLPASELLFTVSARRVYPENNVENPDPEPSPKWLALAEVMAEIHRGVRAGEFVTDTVEDKMENLFELNAYEADAPKDHGTILVLTRDERTCLQVQTFLRFGSKELTDMQLRKLIPKRINAQGSSESSTEGKEETPEEVEDPELGDTFVLALSQAVFAELEKDKKTSLAGCFEESFLMSQTIDKPPPEDKEEIPLQITPTIVIKPWKIDLMSLPQYLTDLKPRWVVMYDVDITVVRQLEVFQRYHPTLPLTVYFLIYGGTVEEQAYLTSLRKEKEAFDSLIEEKGRLVIPEDRSDCQELTRDTGKASDLIAAVATRKGGTESPKKQQSRVIVDMREFRSELPALIHARGIEIEPLTITVGDYILTPDICVERKSVSDLIQSLNSGRLYNQALAMTRNYARPMLLIEFDKDKPFDLQDRYYLSTDSSSEQLVTKLQLLTLHFPQLRLVWSPTPQATAVLFEELKENRPEPDPATAIGVGIEENPADLAFNPSAQAFLQHLPGVTTKNLPTLLRRGGSLDKLRRMNAEELTTLLENSGQAEALHGAIHSKQELGEQGSSGRTANPSTMKGRKRKRFH